MVGVFTINSSELSVNFLESLKSMFMGKEIEISVRETKSSNDYSYSSALENLNSIRSDAVENSEK